MRGCLCGVHEPQLERGNAGLADAAGTIGFDDGYARGPGSVWNQLRGPRFSLILTRSGHDTFTDMVAWQTQIHSRSFRKHAQLGSIAPGRALVAVRGYVNAFLERYLRDRPAPLLDALSTAYPEMRFVP